MAQTMQPSILQMHEDEIDAFLNNKLQQTQVAAFQAVSGDSDEDEDSPDEEDVLDTPLQFAPLVLNVPPIQAGKAPLPPKPKRVRPPRKRKIQEQVMVDEDELETANVTKHRKTHAPIDHEESPITCMAKMQYLTLALKEALLLLQYLQRGIPPDPMMQECLNEKMEYVMGVQAAYMGKTGLHEEMTLRAFRNGMRVKRAIHK